MSGRTGPQGQFYADLLTQALADAGGRIEDPGGWAQSRLNEAAGLTSGQASPVVRQLVERGLLRRELRGRRVYWIELVPEDQVITRPPVHEPVVAPPAPVTRVAEADPVEVARALLAEVLALIEGPRQVAVDAGRLSAALEENGRLRVQVRGLETNRDRDRMQITSLGNERTGLRQRIQQLEANLRAATKDVKHVVDTEVQKRLAAFMQERPQLRVMKEEEQ